MQTKKISKLFYNQYGYKILVNSLLCQLFSSYFNNKIEFDRFSILLEEFEDELKRSKVISYKHWSHRYEITKKDVKEAKLLLDILKNYKCRRRVEYRNKMWIYTNDVEVLDRLKTEIKDLVEEVHQVDNSIREFLFENPKMVVCKTPPEFEYKVYLQGTVDPNFTDWLKTNKTKCKVGSSTLYKIENKTFLYGNYIYVKNEKMLNLVNLVIGHNIKKIEKMVYYGNIDKYKYGGKE